MADVVFFWIVNIEKLKMEIDGTDLVMSDPEPDQEEGLADILPAPRFENFTPDEVAALKVKLKNASWSRVLSLQSPDGDPR